MKKMRRTWKMLLHGLLKKLENGETVFVVTKGEVVFMVEAETGLQETITMLNLMKRIMVMMSTIVLVAYHGEEIMMKKGLMLILHGNSRLIKYSEEKKLAMASLEFEDYAIIWWEQLVNERQEAGQDEIATWAEIKAAMGARFISRRYRRDLFDRLQNLKQASKAECKLQQDAKARKSSSFSARVTPSGNKFMPRANVNRGTTVNSSGGIRSNVSGFSSGKDAAISSVKSKPTVSSSTSIGSTSGSRDIQCFKCGGFVHVIREFPNNAAIVLIEQGEYISASEVEEDFLDDATEDVVGEEDIQYEFEQDKVEEKVYKVIIDGCSCHNLARKKMCDKLGLKLLRHPNPYHVQWPNDSRNIKIGHWVKVSAKIGEYEDAVLCDVVPMTVCYLLLGRPWQFDRSSQYCGRTNQFSIKRGRNFVLKPMTPQQIMAEHMQKCSEVRIESEKEREQNKLSKIHKSMSKSHKPNVSDKQKREGENLVMLATKSEMRDVRNNPAQVLIVLVYKEVML
uniref:Retrotransposon gag domain-containing protein n=1 Tax=Oryza brachyantha TaxID=4533 RepID=J3N826_ORYBR